MTTIDDTVMDAFVAAVAADAVIQQLAEGRPVESWLFAASSLGQGDNPAVPERWYMVWNELEDTEFAEVRETSDARARFIQWYVYDFPGDYARINAVLSRMKQIVKQLAPFRTADGVSCFASEWRGTSGQIPSDGYDSCVKFGSSELFVSR